MYKTQKKRLTHKKNYKALILSDKNFYEEHKNMEKHTENGKKQTDKTER